MAPKKDKVPPSSPKPAKSGGGKQTKKNATGVAYVLHACSKLNSEGQKCDEGTEEAVLAFADDPRRQDSATFGDFVTSETDEDACALSNPMFQLLLLFKYKTDFGRVLMFLIQEEVECHHSNMDTLDIVQEEGIIASSSYEQHSGKFQPKPRLLDTVIEEEEEPAGSHYSVDDTTTGANQSECIMANEESRNDDECTNTTFYGEYQEDEEEAHNIPQESAPDVLEQEEHRVVVSPSNNDTVMGQEETKSNEAETRTDKKGEKKRGRKKKASTNEDEANKSPEKKKLKHSSRRQKNRTLEKELLETPDDDIKHLPIRDMLRLFAYRESLEKKEAKGAPVVPPTQESSNTNASWENQYYSQGFDAEGEFGMEEEGDDDHVQVKPDSPVNYQTYMKKTPRTRWSKQETQVFYEGIQAFGINLSMVQQLLEIEVGTRTLHQVKLKYKLEERKNPLKLNDALSTPCKDLTRYHTVIKKLQAAAAKEREGEGEDEEEEEEAETTSDVPENVEEQPNKSEKTDERAGDGVAGVKESDGGDQFHENEGDDDNDDDDDDDDDFWNSYKSEM